MLCTFHEQVTDKRLLDCLNKHINKWTKLNGSMLDKDKYVTEKYSHIKNYLEIYFLKVLFNE